MSSHGGHICCIYTDNQSEVEFLREKYSKYPIVLLQDIPSAEDTRPILIIGWDKVKLAFPQHNIHDHKIADTIAWCHSMQEKKADFDAQVDSFIKECTREWLPKGLVKFDCFLAQKSLRDYALGEWPSSAKKFIYFYKGGMYVNCQEINYCVNIKNLSLGFTDWREQVTEILQLDTTMCFSYHNVFDFITKDQPVFIKTLENLRWIKFKVETEDNFFDIIHGVDMRRHIPFIMSKMRQIELDQEETAFARRMCFRDFATCILSSAEIAVSSQKKIDSLGRKEIKKRDGMYLLKVHYSNKRTLTGRIVAQDEYNPQNLPKEGPERSYIVSRYPKGKVLIFDFVSFETVLAMLATQDDAFIGQYTNKDLHQESAAIIFGQVEITDEERELAKNINHSLIYGGGQELLMNKLSNQESPEKILTKIRSFLGPIIKKSQELKFKYKEQGYVMTDFGSIIQPEKDYAAFNNYIQATATEIIVDKVIELYHFLSTKKSKLLFQVHDSLVFDIHPEEEFIIPTLKKISQSYKGMDLPISLRIGDNYRDGTKKNM